MANPASNANSYDAILENGSTSLMSDLDRQLRVFKTLSSIIDFAYTFDSRCRFLYANQALLDLLGLELDRLVGKTFLELPYPRDLAVKLHAQVQEVFDTGQKVIDETFYTNPAGKRGCYEYIFIPVFDDDGRVELVAGSTREVSHRKLNEEAHGHLASIIQSSDDAIVSKDLTGVVTSWNPAAERIFGHTAAEMVGASILRIIPPELHFEEAQILAKIRAGEHIDHYETRRVRKNGEPVDVSLTVSPIRNSAGKVIGTSKIARDISARKHLERMLVQSEKIATMGRMAATVSHEVNNPLEAVINLLYLARCNSANNPAVLEYLATAEQEIERVSHLTRQTLGYYNDTNAHSNVALHDLVRDVLRIYKTRIDARRITLETVFDTARPVYASKGELTQVLSNLIANAVDAMPDGGRLRIRVAESNDAVSNDAQIEVLIQDDGCGIAPEHLDKIFEPFFTTKGNLGTGIGLWITKQLVEKHGGHISVAGNPPPMKGTSMRVTLPLTAHAPACPDMSRTPATHGLRDTSKTLPST
jgi:PAS domain S-box-containing protein